MIKDPPLLRIRRGFTRPTEALLAGFAGIPTGYLVDAMNGSGCLDYRIKPLVAAQDGHGRDGGDLSGGALR